MITKESLRDEIKSYITGKIAKSDSAIISNDTKLISGGIMDSITTLQMVDHLEKTYKIEILPHEVDRDNLDTVELIADFVVSKMN
jgi:acyl carrier protein